MSFYRVMKAYREVYPVRLMASVFGVSPSGFYDWLKRKPSARQRRREALTGEVREAFAASHGIYGSRKVAQELAVRRVEVCRNTVAKIMGELGLRSRAQRRRIVGWALSDSLETTLVLEALDGAIRWRRPGSGLLHHSDRGVQYASERYRALLGEHGIACSMSRRGDCWDNAPMERFMGSLKSEWIAHERLANIEQARTSVFRYIDVFYNRQRLHQALGYAPPPRSNRTRHSNQRRPPFVGHLNVSD